MAARAMWKGVLQVADRPVPVKFYSAVEDRRVHFRLLHEPDRVPVKQQLTGAEGEPVDREASAWRAYITREREVVLFTDEELEQLEPEPSREVELLRFVPPAALDDRWYVRPYYLGPDGEPGEYFALAEALRRSARIGIARWVMRNKEYRGALRTSGNHLVMVTLRASEELVAVGERKPPAAQSPSKKELAMAQQLLTMLEGTFDPGEYKNEYRERLAELIEAKAGGRSVPRQRKAPQRAPDDLSKVLEQSLKQGRKRA